MRCVVASVALLTLASCVQSQDEQPPIPANYPSTYGSLIEAAHNEKVLTIWSSTDRSQIEPVLTDFTRYFPGISIKYRELSAENLFLETIHAATHRKPGADLLWSSAMDLQIKLVNDGFVQPYQSPEIGKLPAWAVWKNEAWGITAEPIVIAYNRRLVPEGSRIKTHADLTQIINENQTRLRGRIATYDPSRSAAGFLYLAQDQQSNYDTWDLIRAMGAAKVRLFETTDEILKRMASGEIAIAYNMVGSYALLAQRKNPDIAVVLPEDYTMVMSRIALIPKGARSPNAARLLVDYLLSSRGQAILATRYMSPVRADVEAPEALRLGRSRERAIRVGPALLVHQDKLTRERFFTRWHAAIQQAPVLGALPK